MSLFSLSFSPGTAIGSSGSSAKVERPETMLSKPFCSAVMS